MQVSFRGSTAYDYRYSTLGSYGGVYTCTSLIRYPAYIRHILQGSPTTGATPGGRAVLQGWSTLRKPTKNN